VTTQATTQDQGSGTEPSDSSTGAETPETATETPGSELPNNDGPNGHADEPGNPNADHQFQGQE
jgi:hypothetical protein